MKIGIIGSGIVARTLGHGFIAEGHQVMLGTRNPQKEEIVNWLKEHSAGETGSFFEAAQFGDLVVLAVGGAVADEVVLQCGLENLQHKVVIDTTNPIAPLPPENGVLRFFTNYDQSLMERLQGIAPEARFVKAFSCVGNAFMYKPDFGQHTPTMFICGNHGESRQIVSKLLKEFGWEVEDMGSAASARAIEPLCMLWCIPGFIHNSWGHAFKLLKK